VKQTNPKDAVGVSKVGLHVLSAPVVMEMALAMLEGARKYGSHNYRVAGIRASVYYDATMRHLMAYWEGEDLDEDSGLPHITKALTALAVLRDAQINNKITDDRPPPIKDKWIKRYNSLAKDIIKKYPHAPDPYTKEDVV